MKKPVVFLYVVLVFLPFLSNSQTSAIYTTRDGALQGYDVVAYFTERKPVKGTKEYAVSYLGAKWYFSSEENQKTFETSPEKYAPQFGGYCAYGMSRGYKAKTEPDAWSIVDGKLYLNYNAEVRKIWNEKQPEFIHKANANWPTVKDAAFK